MDEAVIEIGVGVSDGTDRPASDAVGRLTRAGADRQMALKYEREEGKIRIHFPSKKKKGELFETIISYSGTPRIAPNPPWIGGFIWTKTPSGADWISIALQNDGADLLFPVKDQINL